MKLIVTIFLVAWSTLNYAKEIALTFDDLPGQQEVSAAELKGINDSIITTLNKYHAPAIGFVNEIKLYDKGETNKKIAILQTWIDHGFTLGNHTYSHLKLSSTKLNDYENDVIKGEAISKKLMTSANRKYKYFRYPYLDMGKNKQKHDDFAKFLKQLGYIVAPVTIDTKDWRFNRALLKHPEQQKQIIEKYLAYTRSYFDFAEKSSKKIFNRNIKQVWLLHVNFLNSLVLEDLLKIAKEYGYDFIELDKALSDIAYLEPINLYTDKGPSWLYRWDITRKGEVDWSEAPELDSLIATS